MSRQNRLRALQLMRTTDPAAGGPTTYLGSLRPALEAHGVAVSVLRVFERLDDDRWLALGAPWRFRAQLRHKLEAADVVHIHGIFGWHVILGSAAAQAAGIPYVISPHGLLQPAALAQKRLKKAVYRRVIGNRHLARAGAVVATTPAEAEVAVAATPASRVRIVAPGVVVPDACPVQTVPPQRPAGAELNLAYVGRLHPHKELPVALRALQFLRLDGLTARLTVVGDGPPEYLHHLKATVHDLRLEDAVTFTGYLEGAAKTHALLGADLLVLPSRSENFSFVVAEALAQGVPVVISDGVGLADAVREHDCGRVFPVGDARALAHAVAEFRHPGARRAAGLRGYRFAQASLSLHRMGAELDALYRELCEARRTSCNNR